MTRIALCEMLETEEIINLPEPAEDEIIDNENAFYENQINSEIESQDISESLEALNEIIVERTRILSKPEVSLEDLKEFKQKVDIAVSRFGFTHKTIFPSLESHSDPKIAIESTDERIQGSIQGLSNKLNSYIISSIESSQFLLTFYNGQQKRIEKTISDLRRLDGNKKVKISTKKTTALRYGKNASAVESGKDYVKFSIDSMKTLTQLADGMRKFVESDFLSTLKVIFTFLSSKTYKTQFKRLLSITKVFTSLPGVKIGSGETKYIKNFESDVKLGMYKLIGTFPTEDSFTDDPATMKDVASNFSLRIQRIEKFRQGADVVELEMTIKDVLAILENAKELNQELLRYNNIITKMSTYGANSLISGAATSSIAGWWPALFSNFRLHLKICWTIHVLSGATYAVSKSQVNKAVEIANKVAFD